MVAARTTSVVAVWCALAVAACGESHGPGDPASVALLTNTAFVQYDTADYAAEASEMEFIIRRFGIAVTPVIAYDSTSIAATLANQRVFIVPEQELRPFTDSLTAGAKQALRHWVDSLGGVLILANDFNDRALSLTDTLFGHAMGPGFSDFNYSLSSGSAGTPFAGGPTIVWDNDATYAIDATSLPPAAHIIYQGPGSGVVVASIPQGRGTVVLLAWDFYNAEPHGSQDGGWIEVVRRALRN